MLQKSAKDSRPILSASPHPYPSATVLLRYLYKKVLGEGRFDRFGTRYIEFGQLV